MFAALEGVAFAQVSPSQPVQGIPPMGAPQGNVPTSQRAPSEAPAAPLYTPPPQQLPPQMPPSLSAPRTTPGGTTDSQLNPRPQADDGTGPAAAAPALEAQMTALIGRPGGLTSDLAADRARKTSWDVKARNDEARAAQATVDAAALAYVPRLTAKAAYTRLSDLGLLSFGNLVAAPPGTKLGPLAPNTQLSNVPLGLMYPDDNWDLEANLSVPLSDYVFKLAKQYAGASHSAKAAQYTEKAAELTAGSNARILYYSWARARLQQLVAEDALDQAKAHLGDAKAEFNAGKASQADLMGVEAEVAQNELLVVRARNVVSLEEDRLRTSLHDPEGRYEIGEPLLADLPALDGEENFGALYTEALGHRAELRSIIETATGLHAQASSERVGLLPRLDGTGSAQYANPNPRYFPPSAVWNGTWSLGAAITWSATDAILGGTNASNSEARASSAEAQAQSMREGIRDEVIQSWQAVKEAEVAIESTKRSLAAAEESYRVRRALFRAERATSTELSDSENALTRARFDVVNARIDLRIARVRLVHATGRDDAGGQVASADAR
jgi:outer membrane protein TolC